MLDPEAGSGWNGWIAGIADAALQPADAAGLKSRIAAADDS
jgi:hypothetical protein